MEYPQYSEFQVVLETVIEKAIEGDTFFDAGNIIIKSIAGKYFLSISLVCAFINSL